MVRLQLIGANPSPQIQGLAELSGKSNHLLGNDPQKWHINVPFYARVKHQDVYPGIDLVYYRNQRQLEHDFIVALGADPRAITLGLNVEGAVRIDARGDLVLSTRGGELRLYKPRVYQEVGGREQVVPARNALRGKHQVGFEVAAYDPAKPLVIDPVLSYSSFFGGGTDDVGFGMTVDSTGIAYVTVFNSSTNFPTTAGVVQSANAGGFDAFVTKFKATGSSRVYSTYLGGTGDDAGFAIAVDSGGNAYVAGLTNSTNFPTSAGAFQAAFADVNDAFVTKLNSTGTALAYSTYFGGTDDDEAFGIAVDSTGNAYVTGNASSVDFPTTASAFQPATGGGFGEIFFSKIDPTIAGAGSLVYSTYLGGGGDDEGFAIAVDSTGLAYVTGYTDSANFPTSAGVFQTAFQGGAHDAFVAKFDATKSGAASRVYSTYLGGSGGDDEGFGIAADSAGNAYVTGVTSSTTFPTTSGAFQTVLKGTSDAFVTKLNAAGTAPPAYSSYLGGGDEGFGIAADSGGNAYVTGQTASTDFPTTSAAFQPAFGGVNDAFVTKLNAAGNALVYSTYLGGTGDDQGRGIAVDSGGAAYVTGNATTGFTTTAGASQTTFGGGLDDAFVSKVVSNPDFSLAANPTTASVPAGQPATYNLTLTPKEGFNQAVSLSCTGAPSLATCTVSPSPVTLNGSSNSTATVTVTTTAPGSTSRSQWGSLGAPPRGGSARASFLWLLLLAVCATLASLAAAKRRRAWLLSGAATLVFLMCLGCAATSTTPGSPPGNYTLTVTGTSGALSHNINVTLTVQ